MARWCYRIFTTTTKRMAAGHGRSSLTGWKVCLSTSTTPGPLTLLNLLIHSVSHISCCTRWNEIIAWSLNIAIVAELKNVLYLISSILNHLLINVVSKSKRKQSATVNPFIWHPLHWANSRCKCICDLLI